MTATTTAPDGSRCDAHQPAPALRDLPGEAGASNVLNHPALEAATYAADRRQHLEDQLARTRARLRAETGVAMSDIDTCLARLQAIRQALAHQRVSVMPNQPETRAAP
ncbi:hypothetical protein [Kitasatospora sp. McL0602]|uniref:hypothetical protein n=1 Tax=Kitasatospora sp. McL0602 TaxID=3439530 RepID=UPI003F8BCE8D